VAIYTALVIVLPVLISVNRLPSEILSALVFPLLLIRVCGQTITFNPAVNFALWYISGSTPTGPLQLDHLLGPVVGGVLAGLLCLKYFPDDPTCWKRKAEQL
jgi:general stress protein CsbA